jgi:hypothetical protein
VEPRFPDHQILSWPEQQISCLIRRPGRPGRPRSPTPQPSALPVVMGGTTPLSRAGNVTPCRLPDPHPLLAHPGPSWPILAPHLLDGCAGLSLRQASVRSHGLIAIGVCPGHDSHSPATAPKAPCPGPYARHVVVPFSLSEVRHSLSCASCPLQLDMPNGRLVSHGREGPEFGKGDWTAWRQAGDAESSRFACWLESCLFRRSVPFVWKPPSANPLTLGKPAGCAQLRG